MCKGFYINVSSLDLLKDKAGDILLLSKKKKLIQNNVLIHLSMLT